MNLYRVTIETHEGDEVKQEEYAYASFDAIINTITRNSYYAKNIKKIEVSRIL